MSNLARYIKTRSGTKTELHVTSVNITEQQAEFLKEQNLNLSLIVRDAIDNLMAENKNKRGRK